MYIKKGFFRKVMPEKHKSEESVFNMAFAYLKRIDRLLYFSQEAATKQDVNAWLNYLRAIYREVSVKLKTDEEEDKILGKKEDKKADLNNLTKEDATFLNINRLFNDLPTKAINKPKILFLLDQLDVKLRKILQKKGMLLPSKDDPLWAVTKR